jgi:hypothetical protein
MADEKPSLHVDSDWKKQAQEEKKRLADQEAQRAAAAPAPAGAASTSPATAPGTSSAPRGATGSHPAAGRAGAREAGEMPPATFSTLVQSMVTQALFYLGDLAVRGGQPTMNLDMAKHNIDLLGLLEEKTKNNLTSDEKRMIDAALYETRMRYVSVASQLLGP